MTIEVVGLDACGASVQAVAGDLCHSDSREITGCLLRETWLRYFAPHVLRIVKAWGRKLAL